jgi:prolyl-tRNA synthetase
VNQGIEVGHVFKLGTKYSQSMGASILDEKGQSIPLIMGCYGIGVNRILAAAVEAGHDENGIVWPMALSPYQVLLVPLQIQSEPVMAAAKALEKQLEEAGVEVLMDDRDQRPGFKFKDGDLIGIPLRVVVGERGLKEGTIELKSRSEPAARTVPAASAAEAILAVLEQARKSLAATCEARRVQRAAAKRGS